MCDELLHLFCQKSERAGIPTASEDAVGSNVGQTQAHASTHEGSSGLCVTAADVCTVN